MLKIKDVILVETCGACPEQYDAYIEEHQIGYLRLRHGYFKTLYLSDSEEIVYEANTKGDGLFDWDEREDHLTKAKEALLTRYLELNS